MIYFPPGPTLGQQYVGVNGVTYTWMGNRWSGVDALEKGTAEYYVDNGDASFVYNASRDGLLDDGDVSGNLSQELIINTLVNQQYGQHYVTYTLVNVTGQSYDEQGIIVSNPGHCNYTDTGEYCDVEGSYGYRMAFRTHSSGYDFDCSDSIVTNIVDGTYSQAFPYWSFSNQNVEIRVYVKTGSTYYYSPIITTHIDYVPCFVAGTQITLANGNKKAIENITYNDELLVWDFDRGTQSSAKPLWIKRPQTTPEYNHARFADGTELKTLQVGKGHRVFSTVTNQFEFIVHMAVGTAVAKQSGTTTVANIERVRGGMVSYYNIITDYHMNLYANDVLTSTGFNNLYPIKDMKFQKEARVPRTYTGISEHWISGLRLAENTTTDVAEMARHLHMLDNLAQGK